MGKLRNLIRRIGWSLFLWSNKMSEQEYWNMIYEQEKDKQL